MQNLFDLKGKVAVVTGGTGVLGGCMAEALAGHGVKVAILGRNKEKAETLSKKIIENGGEAIPLIADVVDKASLISAKAKLIAKWGKIDILLNAAGGNVSGAVINPEQSILDLKEEDLRQVIDLNQLGTILPCMVFCESMIADRGGVVVNISSMAAQSAITRVLGYSAAKAGVDNFTRWLAVEMAQKYGEGIRVNAISPGFFITEQNKNLLLNKDGTLTCRAQKIIDNTPMSRFGKPEELNGVLLWLCGQGASFVTGAVIPVDGGFSVFSGV